MGQHDAFGLAGCPRGVDQSGEIFGLNGAREGIEDGIALGAAGIGAGDDVGEGDGAFGRGGGVHDEDAFERGSGADGVELVELLAGGNDGDAAAGIVDQHGDLFAGEGGIDGNVGGADGKGGEVGDGPLPAILADDGDAVALLRSPAEKGLASARTR